MPRRRPFGACGFACRRRSRCSGQPLRSPSGHPTVLHPRFVAVPDVLKACRNRFVALPDVLAPLGGVVLSETATKRYWGSEKRPNWLRNDVPERPAVRNGYEAGTRAGWGVRKGYEALPGRVLACGSCCEVRRGVLMPGLAAGCGLAARRRCGFGRTLPRHSKRPRGDAAFY